MRRRQCLLFVHRADLRSPSAFLSASHVARCVARHGVGSQPLPVAALTSTAAHLAYDQAASEVRRAEVEERATDEPAAKGAANARRWTWMRQAAIAAARHNVLTCDICARVTARR